METEYQIQGVPGKYYNDKGSLERIVTAYECVSIRDKRGESEKFLPILVQSCMEPEKITLYPVEIEFKEENKEVYIYISSHGKRVKYRQRDIELSYEEYCPSIQRHGCIPCMNCGRC